MSKSHLLSCAAGAAGLLLVSAADAAIVSFAARPAFLAAVGPTVNENFSGFAVDTEFRTTTVAANGFTMSQEGTNTANFRNLIDVTPLQFADNNGTSHASSFVDFPSASVPGGTNIRVAFPASASGWGADFYGVNGPSAAAEGVQVTVFVNNVAGPTFQLPPVVGNVSQFFGVYGNAGENITSVLLSAVADNGGASGGEGFGMDDFATAAIPEPSSALALLVAATILRRKRA